MSGVGVLCRGSAGHAGGRRRGLVVAAAGRAAHGAVGAAAALLACAAVRRRYRIRLLHPQDEPALGASCGVLRGRGSFPPRHYFHLYCSGISLLGVLRPERLRTDQCHVRPARRHSEYRGREWTIRGGFALVIRWTKWRKCGHNRIRYILRYSLYPFSIFNS